MEGIFSKSVLILAILAILTSILLFQNHNQNLAKMEKEALKTSSPVAAAEMKEIHGVKIHSNPPQSLLDDLAISSWPTWSGEPSKFPWTFTATETMYLLEGKVKVYCDGHDGFFEIGARDLVVFPKAMQVTWDIVEAVKKHYSLEK